METPPAATDGESQKKGAKQVAQTSILQATRAEITRRVVEAVQKDGREHFEVADAAGLTRAEFADIMTGRSEIPVEQLLTISRVLDVPVGWFLTPDVQEPAESVLRTQVIEHHFASRPFVVAAFDREEDAYRFIDAMRWSDCTYTVRVDPAQARLEEQARQLVRDPSVTERLMEMDA